MRPLHDRILVERLEDDGHSLIIIPDIAKENSKIGRVIAAGPKAYGITAGDIVLLPGIAAKYPDWEQCHWMLIRVADVGGIFQPTDMAEA